MKMIRTHLKLRNDQRGASLAYTLVIITILMIIGAVLATFAVMSLRLSVMQHASDKAFYLSDAAMVESLTQLESYVHEAEIYAVARVNDTNRYYVEAKWQAFLRKLETETNNKTISKEESAEKLKIATSFEFHKQYYHYLFGKPDGTNWIEDKHDYTLIDSNGQYTKENNIIFSDAYFTTYRKDAFDFLKDITLNPSDQSGFEASPKPTMSVVSTFDQNAIQLELQSNGVYNRYQKPITLKLSLTPPEYTQVVTSNSTNLHVRINDVLENALSARGDILVSGNNNTIKGDLYTYGTFPNKHNYRAKDIGGLSVGYNVATGVTSFPSASILNDLTTNGKLDLQGNLYARTAVKLSGQDSALTVSGNTYANTITFDQQSKNSAIHIKNNAYLFEDLILDGDNPQVTIGTETDEASGELWGLMDTNPSFTYDKVASSLSSSIIVNTKSASPRVTVNKFFMAGLVHFDVTRTYETLVTWQYQTGESFTTNNNFYFYKTPLVGFNSVLQSNFFEYVDSYNNKHYLVEAIDSNGNIAQSPMFKDKYFYTSSYNNSSAISDRDRSILTVRSINLSDTSGNTGLKENYSRGVMIANKKVIDAYASVGLGANTQTSEYMDEGAFASRQTAIQDAFDLKTSLLSVRNYKDVNNVNPFYKPTGETSITNLESNLEQFVNFNQGQYIRTANPKEIIIVNKEPNKHVYLNIPKASYNALTEQEKNNGIFIQENFDEFLSINGMIITKGNVYVYNTSNSPLTYNGTIVSDGTICLLGTGEKTFQHDPVWIARMSAKHSYLKTALHTSTGRVLSIVKDTTSRNASLAVETKDNPLFRIVDLNSLPTGNGLVKTKTNFSFKIIDWSMD